VVIGGGLLGLEVAAGLRARGCPVTVVHLVPTLMERQLDASGGQLVQRTLEARGLGFATAAQTTAILGADCVTGVQLADGTILGAEMVVMAVGVRPNKTLAQQTGLACRGGVLVDDHLVTSDPNIFALGECSEHQGQVYGFVAPLYEQADVLARRLTGEPEAAFTPEVAATTLKVTGVDVYSVGEFQDEAGEVISLRDFGRGVYRRLSVSDGRLVGAVLCGEVQDGPWYQGLIRRGLDVTPIRDHVVFGKHHVDAWLAAEAAGPPAAPGPHLPSATLAVGGD
jgi:nitrite reductase (NADH) large subunit